MTPHSEAAEPAVAPASSNAAPPAKSSDFLKLAGNALWFLFLVVVLGLLNIFMIFGVGWFKEKSVDWEEFLSDGGLLFYGITLLGGSIYTVTVVNRKDEPLIGHITKAIIAIFIVAYSISLMLTTLNYVNYFERHGFNPPIKGLVTWELIIAAGGAIIAILVNVAVEIHIAKNDRFPNKTNVDMPKGP